MATIYTKIDIDSDIETVWKVLTDFSSYDQWNPFITRASADLNVGGTIDFDELVPDMPKATYKSYIQYVDKNKRFGWWGGIKYVWLVEHTFYLEKISENRTSLVQQEKRKGIVVPFLNSKIDATKQGFVLMNNALKKRSEDFFSKLNHLA